MGLFLSRNGITLVAILAFLAFAFVKAESLVLKHDRRVEERAVAKIEKKTDALVQKAKVAQRRVDPAQSPGVLQKRYCEDC